MYSGFADNPVNDEIRSNQDLFSDGGSITEVPDSDPGSNDEEEQIRSKTPTAHDSGFEEKDKNTPAVSIQNDETRISEVQTHDQNQHSGFGEKDKDDAPAPPVQNDDQNNPERENPETVVGAASAGRNSQTPRTDPNLFLEELYPPIKHVSERRRYEEEFSTIYPIYLGLYRRLRPPAVEYVNLRKQLRTLPASVLSDDTKRSEMGTSLKRKLAEIGFGDDEESKQAREQYEYLLAKVRIIKKRVRDFNAKQSLPKTIII